MNIAVAGTGYVGLSLATLLSQKNTVTAVDIIEGKVKDLNEFISPIQDENIEYLVTDTVKETLQYYENITHDFRYDSLTLTPCMC